MTVLNENFMANALGNSDATFVLSSGARRFRHLSASCRQRIGSVLAVCNRRGVWEHTHCDRYASAQAEALKCVSARPGDDGVFAGDGVLCFPD